MYRTTDAIIDEINQNTEKWGVHAQYATPSEYLSAVRTSAKTNKVLFPTRSSNETFFPFENWSGYFTSRPTLKGMNTEAHAVLGAAEQLHAMHGKSGRNKGEKGKKGRGAETSGDILCNASADTQVRKWLIVQVI